jgi:acyl-CoA thioester hydrolase
MNPPPRAEDFTVWLTLQIRWGDMDALGHLNNSVFFTFVESGRIDYFHTLGVATTRAEGPEGFVLAHAACDFLAQLHYPGEVRVGTRIRAFGRSSIHFEQALYSGDRLAAVAHAVCAWFDFERQKAAPVPQAVRAMVRAREKCPPEEAPRA